MHSCTVPKILWIFASIPRLPRLEQMQYTVQYMSGSGQYLPACKRKSDINCCPLQPSQFWLLCASLDYFLGQCGRAILLVRIHPGIPNLPPPAPHPPRRELRRAAGPLLRFAARQFRMLAAAFVWQQNDAGCWRRRSPPCSQSDEGNCRYPSAVSRAAQRGKSRSAQRRSGYPGEI